MCDFARLDVAQSLAALDVDAANGLADAEVAQRLAEHGPNALPSDQGINWLQLILGQFKDLMVVILLVAAGISWFLGDVKDVVVILAIVLLNAALGISQEYRAEQALAALGALQVPLVRVRRRGDVHQISAEELVPGDVVLLQEGDRVPADGRLIESVNLQVEEAALTGESVPVEKQTAVLAGEGDIPLGDRANMVWMGTSVNYGRGVMAVTQTGLNTELGNIAAMLLQVERGITPLQRRLNRLGQTLAIAAAVVVLLVFIAGLLARHPPATNVPHLHQSGGRRRARRPAGPHHHQPVPRRGPHGAQQRPDPPSARRGDSRLGDRHLFGQDRHAHAQRDDRHRHRPAPTRGPRHQRHRLQRRWRHSPGRRRAPDGGSAAPGRAQGRPGRHPRHPGHLAFNQRLAGNG